MKIISSIAIGGLSFWYFYPWLEISFRNQGNVLTPAMKAALKRPGYGKRLYLGREFLQTSPAILGELMNYSLSCNDYASPRCQSFFDASDLSLMAADANLASFYRAILGFPQSECDFPLSYFKWAWPRVVCWDGLSSSRGFSASGSSSHFFLNRHLSIIGKYPIGRRVEVYLSFSESDLNDLVRACTGSGFFVHCAPEVEYFLASSTSILMNVIVKAADPDAVFHGMMYSHLESLAIYRLAAQLIGNGAIKNMDFGIYQRLQDLHPTHDDIDEMLHSKIDIEKLRLIHMRQVELGND